MLHKKKKPYFNEKVKPLKKNVFLVENEKRARENACCAPIEAKKNKKINNKKKLVVECNE